MRAEQLFLLINEIDERLIAEAEGNTEQPVEVVYEKRFPIKEIITLAACAAALVICVFTVMNFRQGITPPDNSNSSAVIVNSSGSENVSSADSSDTSETSETSETSDTSDSESVIPAPTVSLNPEVIWGMHKTFDEVSARYGEITSGNHNVYNFENGFGRYVWDSYGIDPQQPDRDTNIEITEGNGGVRMIDNIMPHDLINGEFTALGFEDFASQCGFEIVSLGKDEPYTMYDGYRTATFTHPSYENMIFWASYSEETGVIDDDTLFTIKLNVTLNREVLWGLGKTFDEVSERYGEVTSGNFNTYFFDRGWGRYVWDYGGGIDNSFSDVNENIEYIKTRGGVVMMDNIKAVGFLNYEYPVTLNYDQFAEICGITYTGDEEPPSMYDLWARAFVHPLYENYTFVMYMEEPGVIDETTTFMVRSDDF
ncbi:MAG: hypothetical protein HDT43_10285 [Ruminococcaceae bacterium]|nr:hypothetical protein [Oscillospiraceae bacterium]